MAEPHASDVSNRLLGMKVYDIASRKLGQVVEVRTDDATGEVACLIVEDDGILGFRKHRVSMPWSMVTYSEVRHALVFAPGVHRDHEEHMPPPETHAIEGDRPAA